MNAAVVHSFEAPPRYTSFDEPIASESELLVEVIAAGLHPIVKSLANGTHYGSTGELPFIPGVDGVGRLPDGSLVYFGGARPPFGTFAERALASRSMSLPLPAGLEPATAAGMANPGMSSWVALTARARFVPGENVLILGATGLAGQLAIQIAKHLGAQRVVAAGRNPEVLETLPQLAARVRFIQIGDPAGKTISLAAATLRSSAIELLGSGFGSASMDQIFAALRDFFHAAATSSFKLNIKPVPLRDVEALWNSPERKARLVFLP